MSKTAGGPKEVLLRMLEMFASDAPAAPEEVVADTFQDHPGLGGSDAKGPNGFAELVAAAHKGFTSVTVDVKDVVTEGDRAAARISWRGVMPGGEVIERETINLIRVVDGRAVEHWGALSWLRLGK